MFLDEELEQIWTGEGSDNEKAKAILTACGNRLLDPKKCSVNDFIVTMKQTDNGYRLFAKRHPEIKVDGFRNIMLSSFENEADRERIKKAFHW